MSSHLFPPLSLSSSLSLPRSLRLPVSSSVYYQYISGFLQWKAPPESEREEETGAKTFSSLWGDSLVFQLGNAAGQTRAEERHRADRREREG